MTSSGQYTGLPPGLPPTAGESDLGQTTIDELESECCEEAVTVEQSWGDDYYVCSSCDELCEVKLAGLLG